MFEPFPFPDWLPLAYKRQRSRAMKTIQEVMPTVLSEAASAPGLHLGSLLREADSSADPSYARRDRYEHALTFLIAGFHTSAELLLWSVRLLAQHSEVQQRVAAECEMGLDAAIASRTTAGSSSYLECVLKETLRLYPAAWSLFARQASHDVWLGRYPIRKGSLVFLVPWVTHRDERFFREPLRFDPDRFAPTADALPEKGSYFPFGLGPHICIGATTALEQVKAILSALLRRFRIQPITAVRVAPQLSVNLALRSLDGCPLQLVLRNAPVKPPHTRKVDCARQETDACH
jgi:cytochrome P450